ncbi:hypothetical protein ANANG_G00231110 [Anguilla anguilla]|uniref:DNA topoisomerase I eukaryotic-type domain-containing protein n=1 Tax=Anguilla anguilla TaxID=7936 RepID=A0A9D3LTE3_ANGAN|nr:hypothetical protein ANANG_G00231110 [Anguilla anguilla]
MKPKGTKTKKRRKSEVLQEELKEEKRMTPPGEGDLKEKWRLMEEGNKFADDMKQKQKEDTDCLLSWKKKPGQDSKPMRPIKIMKEEGNQQWRWYRGRCWTMSTLPKRCSVTTFLQTGERPSKRPMRGLLKSMATALWTSTVSALETSGLSPQACSVAEGTTPNGMLKRRIQPEDVIINCSKQSKIPEPPAGHRWKEVRRDNTITWLASWTENIQSSCKYITLHASSELKGEKDWEKYEVARRLRSYVDQIRSQYYQDMDSKEMLIRQRATALYFIDKLALRVGNEKVAGRQRTRWAAAPSVWSTSLCTGTWKRLAELSCKSDGKAEKVLAYNRANCAVAVLCNHQRAEPKSFEQSMASLQAKINSKTQDLAQAKTELKLAKWKAKGCPGNKLHVDVEKKRKATRRLEDQLLNLNIQATERRANRSP